MVTKKVSKQSWTALLEHHQLQIRPSVDRQCIIIANFRLSSQLFFEQLRPNIALKNVARHRERSSFQPFCPTLTP